jgi:rhodanese-related sulfurtransferase
MSAIDGILEEARSELTRLHPEEAEAAMRSGALLVDTRPLEQRQHDGEIPGALVIDRNVLEWRLDPSCEHCILEARANQRVIVICNQGYSSSLAAATLQRLGLRDATDVIGGFQAWAACGLPVVSS